MHARAANAYRRVDLESAPKHQILDRLFERFAQDVAAARAAIEARDIAAKASAIDHALAILTELVASLDHAAAPELCANLAALYDFAAAALTEASATMRPEPLERAARIMTELGAAFRGVPR